LSVRARELEVISNRGEGLFTGAPPVVVVVFVVVLVVVLVVVVVVLVVVVVAGEGKPGGPLMVTTWPVLSTATQNPPGALTLGAHDTASRVGSTGGATGKPTSIVAETDHCWPL
jgi:hypothetical protein